MMTPTFTPEAFAALGAPALVYVRPDQGQRDHGWRARKRR